MANGNFTTSSGTNWTAEIPAAQSDRTLTIPTKDKYIDRDISITLKGHGISTFTPNTTYFQPETTGAVNTTAAIPANKYTTSNQYLITGTAGAITGGVLTHGDITTNDTTYLTNTDTGYSVTFSNTASRAAASYNITKTGWISNAGAGLSATGDDTKTLTKYIKKGVASAITGGGLSKTNAYWGTSNISGVSVSRAAASYSIPTAGWISRDGAGSGLSAATQYLTGVKIEPPTSGTRSFYIEVPNGSTDDYVTFTFKVDKDCNVWVE